ncbi:MAG TPA: VOC family protein, partial [Candidatus Dormibacteraeota bacterium]|nr:VOC family protein [Candidatus Dormibacteraeota bacterium]
NVEFYAGTMGMRLVKKTVNQDDPGVYHLFYGDEKGSAGFDLTFFEYPGAARGRAGAGMVHQIAFRVGSQQALDFWNDRLRAAGIETVRGDGRVDFHDPEGLTLQLRHTETTETPLVPLTPEIPAELAVQGFDGVRAYTEDAARSRDFLMAAVDFTGEGDSFTSAGNHRSSFYSCDRAPGVGTPGAGTVHHVAFASQMDDHTAWRDRVLEAGGHPTPVIDRFYFRSVYFREPSGVLFEIATIGPGFATDEDPEHLGERLSLPPAFEHLRSRVEATLTPLPNPRAAAATRAGG